MRYIQKPADEPAAIREYVEAQSPLGHGLDYKTFSQTASPRGGSRGGELCRNLVEQQYGLCAYTGAGIDERLGKLSDPSKKLKFKVHNEHLKAQSVCKDEVKAAGKVYGEVVGDDMAHWNMVAALLVAGAGGKTKVIKSELFGAAHRENDPVPVLPTDPTCESRFVFDTLGEVAAAASGDAAAEKTIGVLNLNHQTLAGWRETAIDVFTEIITSRADAEMVIQKTTVPENGRLPEYCFAIRQAAQSLMELDA